MNALENEKPLIQNCVGDFSDLKTVYYKKRFLYSKYNPVKSIEGVIRQKAPVLSGTIVLIFSPCLWYGFDSLIKILPESSSVIAVEADDRLYELALKNMPAEQLDCSLKLFSKDSLSELDRTLRNLAASGKYKRILQLDFSAGTLLDSPFYSMVANAAQEIIAAFWMNRITLVRMGRLFSKNLFSNLRFLGTGSQLYQYEKSMSLPVLVCGAGESLDKTIIPEKGIFIIAVDAAVSSLLARGVCPDAVVSLESQSVIQKAYIGAESSFAKKIPFLFADIASRPSVPRSVTNKTIWFASRYAECSFLDSLQSDGVVHDFMQPLGSVGLAAVAIALRIRKSADVPVFVTGLDFSYSAGRTHAKHAPAMIQRWSQCDVLHPAENYDSAFSPPAFYVEGKNKMQVITIKSMQNYAESFKAVFSKEKNLFDIGLQGVSLNLPLASQDDLFRAASLAAGPADLGMPCNSNNGKHALMIEEFYARESSSLKILRDLLTYGEQSIYRDGALSLSLQIENLLRNREYLYLHFPDGYRLSMETNFLKRVRAEIDFFLKYIDTAL